MKALFDQNNRKTIKADLRHIDRGQPQENTWQPFCRVSLQSDRCFLLPNEIDVQQSERLKLD